MDEDADADGDGFHVDGDADGDEDGDGDGDVGVDGDDGRPAVGARRAASPTAAAGCCRDSAGPPKRLN